MSTGIIQTILHDSPDAPAAVRLSAVCASHDRPVLNLDGWKLTGSDLHVAGMFTTSGVRKLLGIAVLFRRPSLAHQLIEVSVEFHARRQKIGTALIRHVEEFAEMHGHRPVYSTVPDLLADAFLRSCHWKMAGFYRKRKYTPNPGLVKWRDEQCVYLPYVHWLEHRSGEHRNGYGDLGTY